MAATQSTFNSMIESPAALSARASHRESRNASHLDHVPVRRAGAVDGLHANALAARLGKALVPGARGRRLQHARALVLLDARTPSARGASRGRVRGVHRDA